MVEISCLELDRHAIESQFISHIVCMMLANLNLESTPINTKGYETLLRIVENTCGDNFDLYYGFFILKISMQQSNWRDWRWILMVLKNNL